MVQKIVTFYLSEELLYVLDCYQKAYDLPSRTAALRILIRSLELKIRIVEGKVKTVEVKGSPHIDVEKFRDQPRDKIPEIEKLQVAANTQEPEKKPETKILKKEPGIPTQTSEKVENSKEKLPELKRCPYRKGSLVKVALVCAKCKRESPVRVRTCQKITQEEIEKVWKVE